MTKLKLAYIGCSLPSRTETFVSNEIIELKRQGWDVETFSVHTPEAGLGSEKLDELSEKTILIYSIKSVSRLIKEMFIHPIQTFRTLCYSLRLVISNSISLEKRLKLFVQVMASISVAQEMRDRKIEHIHSHMAHVPTTIALFLAKHLSIPFSFTGHAADLFRDRILLEEKLQNARFIACISDWHRSFYQKIVFLADKKLPIIRCGVDVHSFVPKKSENHPLHLLSLGRLVPKKGHLYLLPALRILEEKGVLFSCLIIGDGPERDLLAKKIEKLKLHGQVKLLGVKNHSEVKEYIQGADLFILPCVEDSEGDKDGIPVALMEAMACEVPVIAGDLPTIRELINSSSNGVLIDPTNKDQFAIALEEMMEDSVVRERLGKAGRKTIKKEYDLEKNVAKLGVYFEG